MRLGNARRKNRSSEEWAAKFRECHCSPRLMSQVTGEAETSIYRRRKAVEATLGISLDSIPTAIGGTPRQPQAIPKLGQRHLIDNFTGPALVFSDAHFWPDDLRNKSPAHKALLAMIPLIKPGMIICNGDAFDGARLSRFDPRDDIEKLPKVEEELAACQEAMTEIANLAPENCILVWVLGNHDRRYWSRLVNQAPDFVRIAGLTFEAQFPQWSFCMSAVINGHTVIVHRYHGGIHACWNNITKGQASVISSDTHRLFCMVYRGYLHTVIGAETGMLSRFGPAEEKFSYTEERSLNWHPGFLLAHFSETGKLKEPELIRVQDDGTVEYRGERIV